MNIHPRLVVALVVVATMGAADRESSAQTVGSPRPQGLFGGARTTQAPESLDVIVSLTEGWDRDIPPELHARLDRNSLQTGGFSTMLNASAQYASRGPRAQVGANAVSMLRHYTELGVTQSVGHSAGVGVNMRMPARMALLANQSASYSPTYFYSLFPGSEEIEPGDAGSTAPDFAVVDGFESINYVSTATLRYEPGRRRAFDVGGDYRYTDRLHETPDWRDVSTYSLRAGYSFNPARNSGIATALHYRAGDFGYAGTGSMTEVGVNVGWNYTRPLSATRSVEFGVNVGVTGADLEQVEGGLDVLQRQYRATGGLRLSFPVGATWQVTGDFSRGFRDIPDLPTPAYTSGASVSTVGLITSRLDVNATAGYSRGESALDYNRKFDTYTGNVRVRYAINQMFAAYGEYLYYYYDFHGDPQLLLRGIPTGLERNGVRVGLTMWVPALRR